MKRTLIACLCIPTLAVAQSNLYSVEDIYGGGIGYSTMYMILDSLPGQSIIRDLGLPLNNIQSKPFVLHGGEGFAQMAGPWRLGGYAGMGTAQTSNVYNIWLYVNRDDSTGYQEPAFNIVGDTLFSYADDLSVEARTSLILGAITVEYVVPLFRDLEVTAGALIGIGRYSLSIDQQIGTPSWGQYSNHMYGYIDDENELYFLVDTTGKRMNNAVNFIRENHLRPVNVTGTMTDLSGVFFNFQPYLSLKWQFLDRMGLRLSAGFNKGTIGAGKWKLNGHFPISDSPKSSIQGFTLRAMIYFGM